MGRRERGVAMPRRDLGLGQSGGRRGFREAMPRRSLDRNEDQRNAARRGGGKALSKWGSRGRLFGDPVAGAWIKRGPRGRL